MTNFRNVRPLINQLRGLSRTQSNSIALNYDAINYFGKSSILDA